MAEFRNSEGSVKWRNKEKGDLSQCPRESVSFLEQLFGLVEGLSVVLEETPHFAQVCGWGRVMEPWGPEPSHTRHLDAALSTREAPS